jgi:putative drug exporter of the RND superfamily
VRLVLVPATMQLMGNWNWWMPEWLGRVLPEADFESDHAIEDERAPAVV